MHLTASSVATRATQGEGGPTQQGMTPAEARRKLGVSEEAGFEQVLRAKNKLIQQNQGDTEQQLRVGLLAEADSDYVNQQAPTRHSVAD